jgi:hypothetical protein
MHILDPPIVSKQLLEILARFLVDVCSEYNPAFDRADRYCSSSSSYLGRAVVLVSGGWSMSISESAIVRGRMVLRLYFVT